MAAINLMCTWCTKAPGFLQSTHLPTSKESTIWLAEQLVENGFEYGLEP